MVVFVVVAAAIASLNAMLLFESLQVLTGAAYVQAFGVERVRGIAMLLLDMQHYGLLTAQVFFGLWLAPLGYLAIKSARFPRALGISLIAAAVCYVSDVFLAFTLPSIGQLMRGILVVPCVAIAEIWMVLYLLVIGIRSKSAGHE